MPAVEPEEGEMLAGGRAGALAAGGDFIQQGSARLVSSVSRVRSSSPEPEPTPSSSI